MGGFFDGLRHVMLPALLLVLGLLVLFFGYMILHFV